MKYFLIFLISFIMAATLIFFYNSHHARQIIQNRQKLSHITSAFSQQQAPKEAITGTISSLSGDVAWQSRTASEPANINKPTQIQQGEKLVTNGTGNVAVSFSGIGQIQISPQSTLDIIQTLPANAVFTQSQGNVEYIKDGTIHVSVRSLHALIDMSSGDISIEISKTKPSVTIHVIKGDAIIAFNDLQNVSNITHMKEGQIILYNDTTREIQ